MSFQDVFSTVSEPKIFGDRIFAAEQNAKASASIAESLTEEKTRLKGEKTLLKQQIAGKDKEWYGSTTVGIIAYQTNYTSGLFGSIASNLDYYFPGIKAEKDRKELVVKERNELNAQLDKIRAEYKPAKARAIKAQNTAVEDQQVVESFNLVAELVGEKESVLKLPYTKLGQNFDSVEKIDKEIERKLKDAKVVVGETKEGNCFVAFKKVSKLFLTFNDTVEEIVKLQQENPNSSKWYKKDDRLLSTLLNCKDEYLAIAEGKVHSLDVYNELFSGLALTQMEWPEGSAHDEDFLTSTCTTTSFSSSPISG